MKITEGKQAHKCVFEKISMDAHKYGLLPFVERVIGCVAMCYIQFLDVQCSSPHLDMSSEDTGCLLILDVLQPIFTL